MPGLLMAFFIAIGAGGASALWGPPHAWSGVDPTARTKLGRPERGVMTSLSVPSVVLATRDVYGRERCTATVLAISRGQVVRRVQIDGQEQNLDWSWTVDLTAKPGQRRNVAVWYLAPNGGARTACHQMTFVCVTPGDESVRTEEGTRCE